MQKRKIAIYLNQLLALNVCFHQNQTEGEIISCFPVK